MSKNEKLDPKKFDLGLFLAGCTPSTAFVTVYGDRKAASELRMLIEQWEETVRDEEESGRVYGIGEVSPADKLKQQITAKKTEIENSKLVVEIREIVSSVRAAIKNAFLENKGVTDKDLVDDPELQLELDKWVFAKAIVFPDLKDPATVAEFKEAIGDTQWTMITEAWMETLSDRVNLDQLTPSFLQPSSPSNGGDK